MKIIDVKQWIEGDKIYWDVKILLDKPIKYAESKGIVFG